MSRLGPMVSTLALGFGLLFVAAVARRFDAALQRQKRALQDLLAANWSHVRSVLPLFATALLCHFYQLSHLLLSIDDEYAATRHDPSVWLGQGRWTIYWLERLLFKQPTVPFLPEAGYCMCMALTYALLCRVYRIKSPVASVFVFPLFCASPVLMVLAEFYANVPSLGLGFLSSACALAFFAAALESKNRRQQLVYILAQVLFLAVALGCYQSFVQLFGAFATVLFLQQMQAEPALTAGTMLRRQGALVLSCAAGLAAYSAVQRLHLLATHGTTPYIDQLFDVASLWRRPLYVIGRSAQTAWSIYRGSSAAYGTKLVAVAAVFYAGLAALFAAGRSQRDFARQALFAAFALQLLIFPFALTLLTGGQLPLRTFVAAPFVLWFLAWQASQAKLVLWQGAALVSIAGAILQILLLNGQYAAQMDVAQSRDRAFAAQLYARIEQSIEGFCSDNHYEVDVFGSRAPQPSVYVSAPTSTTGASFFNWDGGNPERIVLFMNVLGYGNLHLVSQQTRERLNAVFANMPAWPAPGCIQLYQGRILVKLAPQPGVFHRLSAPPAAL